MDLQVQEMLWFYGTLKFFTRRADKSGIDKLHGGAIVAPELLMLHMLTNTRKPAKHEAPARGWR